MTDRARHCEHPAEQRWQFRYHWMCCACGRCFEGIKLRLPSVDIYGRPT